MKRKLSLIPVLIALSGCAPTPRIVRIQAQNDDLVLNLATETHPDCGTISLGAERISYIIACTQGGKANLPRHSVRLNWQAGELAATRADNGIPLFRVRCNRTQFDQIKAWQHAAPKQ